MENHSDGFGGVILVQPNSKVRVENSTFHKNSAKHSAGVAQVFAGDISLIHVTMTQNFLTEQSDAGNTISKMAAAPDDSKVSLHNSIIDGPGGVACAGGLDQISGNLSTDGTCAYERTAFARLGDLTGSPAYFPLLDQSPAVDAADPEFCLERIKSAQIGRRAAAATSARSNRRQPCPVRRLRQPFATCRTRLLRRTPIKPIDLARPGTAPTPSI